MVNSQAEVKVYKGGVKNSQPDRDFDIMLIILILYDFSCEGIVLIPSSPVSYTHLLTTWILQTVKVSKYSYKVQLVLVPWMMLDRTVLKLQAIKAEYY